ncbi:MAG: T9SS type A sorting domain-containing protein [Ignavibacteria bacterium]
MNLIKKDLDENLWIIFFPDYIGGQSIGGGIVHFTRHGYAIFTPDNSPLPTTAVWDIEFSRTGKKFFATSKGLVIYDGNSWILYDSTNSPLKDVLNTIEIETDTILWIGTYRTGLYRFDGYSWQNWNYQNSPLYSLNIEFLKIDQNKKLWIGSRYGALQSYWNNNWETYSYGYFTPFTPYNFNNPTIYSGDFDRNGDLWILGLSNSTQSPRKRAIAKVKDSVWNIYDNSIVPFLGYPNYFGIAVDSNNIKWFADIFKGLIRFNDTSWTLMDSSNSPIRKAFSIVVDKFNNKIFPAELNQVDSSGNYLMGIVFYNEKGVVLSQKENNFTPSSFEVYQNYPNPFNSSTTISFSLPANSDVDLIIFNTIGEVIFKTRLDNLQAGKKYYQIQFDHLTSGIYFYSVRTKFGIQTRKMLLIK